MQLAEKSLARQLLGLQQAITPSANVGNRTPIVPFGEWTPDRSSFQPAEAKNVIPHADGYQPFQQGVEISQDAATDAIQGAAGMRVDAGDVYIFSGDKENLYRMTGSLTHNDVSSTTYSTAIDGNWEFAQWGTNSATAAQVIATNYIDPVQIANIASGNFSNMISSGTEKPTARHVNVINNFVVLGNVNSTADDVVPNRVHWSAIGNEALFDPDSATQCDYQDIPVGGAVAAITPGANYGLVFQQEAINRMSYVGGRRVFRFDTIDDQRGTLVPNSVCPVGRMVFYWSEEGIFVTDGQQSYPIGSNKVDRWLLDQFNVVDANRLSCSVDSKNKVVAWAFPGENSSSTPNRILLYNWDIKRFSHVDIECEVLIKQLKGFGYDLESLASIGTDIDDTSLFPLSFDSSFYSGGSAKFGCYGTDHKVDEFSGDNLAATMDTGDFQPSPGQSVLTGISPIVASSGDTAISNPPTVKLASRLRTADAMSFGSAVSQNSFGKANFATQSKYFRARVDIAAGETWGEAQGVEVEASAVGAP